MKYGLCLFCFLFSCNIYADTIANYISIAGNIPMMELKPDPQSQAWARSARQILAATDETITETLVMMNGMAGKQGKPIFCLPEKTTVISTDKMDEIIKQTYTFLAQNGADTKTMSVSEVAMLGFIKAYPCGTKSG